MSVFNQSRSAIIRLIFLALFVVIIAQLVNLQLFSGKYKQMAFNNAVYSKVEYPSRGIIFDRKGRAILNNTIMYDLVVTPNQVKNIDTITLCSILKIDTSEFRKRITDAVLRNGRYRPGIFQDLLPPEVYSQLDENMYKFTGFDLVERPVRTYPYNVAAQILGYIGEADSSIIKRSGGFYRLGDYVGRSGIEQFYEPILMGQRGVKQLIKDNKNRLVGSYEDGIFDTTSIAGRNLRTYIDVEVQQLAERLMTNKVGGVVVIEPKTGGIIAMASGPTYDPNLLTGPYKKENFNKLFRDVSSPMLNRSIQGQYEPGSTFKPLGGLVALDEGVITPAFGYPCPGVYLGCGSGKPRCTHSGGGHAANLRLATANSCNSYFTHVYRLAVDNPKYGNPKIGYMKWKEYMNAFGLGNKLGIDLPGEIRGNIPDTSVYNKENNNHWNSCTNLTLGIGQDKMQVTPVQLANAVCIIANKGYYYTPHFVERIEEETKNDTILNAFRKRHNVLTHIPDEYYNVMIEGMHDVVQSGTARSAQIEGIPLCAKTGTAEKYRTIDGKRVKLQNNSVFICFAPKDDPKIAVAIIVENAGYGATWAGRMASLIVEKYLKDTLPPARARLADEIANTNKMPGYLVREQYKADSVRAFNWFKLTKDSSSIKKYMRRGAPPPATPPVVPPSNQHLTTFAFPMLKPEDIIKPITAIIYA